jgi:sugar phosphate permease
VDTAKTHRSAPTPSPPHTQGLHLRPYHFVTISLLALGYCGYYFCRSNLPVVLPDLIRYLSSRGVPAATAQVRLGFIASAGVVAYGTGKFFFGALADLWGGRRNFLGGMAAAVAFTALFAMSGGLPLFTLAWVMNRLFQSAGWAGLVKVSSRWFPYSLYGTVMAVLSLSFLFGDAACRWTMGRLIARGMDWRQIFWTSAGFLALLLVASFLFLRETPEELGLPSPEANPLNVYEREGESPAERASLAAILRPLISNSSFWLVCLLSLGTTLLRETFNFWTPTYFVQYVGLSDSQAASRSALFPFFGGVAVLLAGVLSDKLGLNGRNLVLVCGISACALCLILLGHTPGHANSWTPVTLVALVGFLLLGPYSYLAGAMSLDFGGKRGSATASGIIDGVGYLGSFLSGDTMARITVHAGWRIAFEGLAGIAMLTALGALVLVVRTSKANR